MQLHKVLARLEREDRGALRLVGADIGRAVCDRTNIDALRSVRVALGRLRGEESYADGYRTALADVLAAFESQIAYEET